MKSLKIYITILLSFLIVSCTTTDPTLQIMNLSNAKKLVQNYYESGEFDKESMRIIDEAIGVIDKMELKERSAVIFDVDETTLSNYKISKETGFGFIPKLWDEWQLRGIADVLPHTKRFYDFLISKNIHVIFMTGRQKNVWAATKRNLIEKGFIKFDTLIVREIIESEFSAAEFKSRKRKELLNDGYNIIASIGDQLSDFAGGNSGYKIKLPNYLYLLD